MKIVLALSVLITCGGGLTTSRFYCDVVMCASKYLESQTNVQISPLIYALFFVMLSLDAPLMFDAPDRLFVYLFTPFFNCHP